MIRKIRLAALMLVLVMAFAVMPAHAVTIGELLGWNKESEEQTQQNKDYGSDRKEDTGSEQDYYETLKVDKDASYDTRDEVCAYLVQYHCLPSNYMTKNEARSLGWEGGSLNNLIPGKCIGGSYFSNYEEILPVVDGREYHECDIDTLKSKNRGAKRIVYSGDDDNQEWNIYYTDDHYETFELLWGDDNYE